MIIISDKCIKIRIFDEFILINKSVFQLGCEFKLKDEDRQLYYKYKRFVDRMFKKIGIYIKELNEDKSIYIIDYI